LNLIFIFDATEGLYLVVEVEKEEEQMRKRKKS